jgi:DNA mismatch repair protein MutL
MGKYGQEEVPQQSLMTPFIVNRPRTLADLTHQIKEELHNLGFDAEEFGNNSYIVKSIPAFLPLKEAEAFVREYLDTVTPGVDYENKGDKNRIIVKACKSAVKAKDALEAEEVRALLKELEKCDNPFNCPHGRPIFIKLSIYDIERMFKRV